MAVTKLTVPEQRTELEDMARIILLSSSGPMNPITAMHYARNLASAGYGLKAAPAPAKEPGEPMVLWATSDIAEYLGLESVTVRNWAYQGHPNLPSPHAVTRSGRRLWTAEQVERIAANRSEKAASKAQKAAAKAQRKADKAAAKAREERILARLVEGGVKL
jgi:hypothetical protein